MTIQRQVSHQSIIPSVAERGSIYSIDLSPLQGEFESLSSAAEAAIASRDVVSGIKDGENAIFLSQTTSPMTSTQLLTIYIQLSLPLYR